MNNTARVVLEKKKTDSATQMLRDLHWLPVRKRIDYKIATLCYGFFDNSLPVYLANELEIYTPKRTLRSSSDNRIFVLPKCNMRVGEKAWTHAGPKVWNALPAFLRNSKTKNAFKKNLKTYYFNLD